MVIVGRPDVEDLSILKIVVTNVEVEAIMHEIVLCTAEAVDGKLTLVNYCLSP